MRKSISLITAGSNYATAKHGEMIVSNAKQYGETFSAFIAGAQYKAAQNEKKIKELTDALKWILQETRNDELTPGGRLYNIANKCVQAVNSQL